MDLDLTLFEPLNGAMPFRVLSEHPTEPLVALQVLGIRGEDVHSATDMRSAIWDRETHKLVTVPEDTIALAWDVDGRQLGLMREYYNDGDDIEVGSIYSYSWERLSWPEQELLSSCGISFPAGWPELVAFSPQGDLTVVQWFDADMSGLELIGLQKYGDAHLDPPPWENAAERLLDDERGGFMAVGTNPGDHASF